MAQTEFPQSFTSYNMYYDNHDAPPSRLPRPTQQRGTQNGHRRGQSQPSKLEMLQSDYQKKLLREKEAKMIEMYERQQEMAMRKVSGNSNKRGIVRDFFEERRAMEKHGNTSDMPSMAAHFKNKKRERDRVLKQPQEPRKTSAGVNRATRLAPIGHRNNPTRGYAVTNYHGNNDYSSNDNDQTPTPPISRKPKLVRSHRTKQSPVNYYDNTPPYSDEDVPPQKSNLKSLHEKKKKEQKWDRQKDKLSDFQRWQMEQNMQRQKRLEKLKMKQDMLPESDDEDEETIYQEPPKKEPPTQDIQTVIYEKIRQKELELQSMIEQQQLEENKMRLQEEKELEERKRKQKQRLEEERLRRAKQEEERMEKERMERERQEIRDNNDRYTVDSYSEEAEIEPVRYSKPKPKKTVKRPPPPPAPEKEPEDEEDYYANTVKDNFYETVEDDSEVNLDLKPCPSCGRKFNRDRLAKHVKVCKQTTNKKRKVFDMTKKRTTGTEMEKYVRQGKHLDDGPKTKPSSWRKKHEDFQQAIKAARDIQEHIAKGGKATDLPPPPPSTNPDYKQCPYCKRRFNPDVADRHIPKCKDIKNRPPPPKRR